MRPRHCLLSACLLHVCGNNLCTGAEIFTVGVVITPSHARYHAFDYSGTTLTLSGVKVAALLTVCPILERLIRAANVSIATTNTTVYYCGPRILSLLLLLRATTADLFQVHATHTQWNRLLHHRAPEVRGLSVDLCLSYVPTVLILSCSSFGLLVVPCRVTC